MQSGRKMLASILEQLVDPNALVVPLLPVLAMPMGRAVCEKIVAALARAGIELASVGAR